MKTGELQFGDFILDCDERALTRRGIPVSLPPNALKLLLLLAENRGRIVEKNELMQHVWSDTFVEEGNIAYTVRLLRKAIGDNASDPRYIQTVPRRGYRFSADASLAEHGDEKRESSLVGRTKELAELAELLADQKVRLVTLTGSGGTGKTTLANEIALLLAHKYPDGVFFVDLSTVSDTSLLSVAIAHELGIKDTGARPAAELLSMYLRDKSPLLILDNFEQLVSAGVELADLAGVCPGIKILVTSREPLKLSIEKEYRVPPLGVPSGAVQDLADLMGYDAGRLFVRRAQAAREDLELKDEDAAAVAAICQKLDGLPLALELAASRAKVLSVHEIVSKLEDSLGLLTGGPRDVHHRQQTMRAAIDWSFDLLDDVEKRVFLMLSIFEGGFTFAAAERVLARTVSVHQPLSGTDSVDAITSLTAKGLLHSYSSAAGDLCFRMLNVVRDHAIETRVRQVDLDELSRAHAEYCKEFSVASSPFLFSSESPRWLLRFDFELGNVRTAIRWSLKNDPQMAAEIIAAWRHLAGLRLHIGEVRYWLEEILKIADEIAPALRCDMFTGLGILCQYQLDLVAARSAHEQALQISRKLSDAKLVARNLRGIAAISYMELDLNAARTALGKAVDLSRSVGDEFGEAAAFARLGDVSNAECDYENARLSTKRALDIFKRLGYKQGIGSKLANLSITEFNSGNYAAARQCLIESLNTSIEIGDEIDYRINFEVAAALMIEAGDHETAARLSGMAAARCEEMAYFYEPVEQRFKTSCISKLKDAMDETQFERAFAEGRKMTIAEAVALTRVAGAGTKHEKVQSRLVERRR